MGKLATADEIEIARLKFLAAASEGGRPAVGVRRGRSLRQYERY
jgi:hypothetical protein